MPPHPLVLAWLLIVAGALTLWFAPRFWAWIYDMIDRFKL